MRRAIVQPAPRISQFVAIEWKQRALFPRVRSWATRSSPGFQFQMERAMAQKSATTMVALAAFGMIALTTALGVHGLQARQTAREVAALPVVRMERVIIVGERTQAERPAATQLANNPTPTVR
jgi:hypothetical protein